jgi:CheY-like chemotaxis protein
LIFAITKRLHVALSVSLRKALRLLFGGERLIRVYHGFPTWSVTKERMQETQAKPKVLVADDERVIADTLAIILNQSGFEATAVYSGEKAVEAAKTLQPDMLISDVIMTDLNGIDAAIRIRSILPSCKILLFSGQAATADLLDRARGQGHEFEILAKPVHPQDLLARLRS